MRKIARLTSGQAWLAFILGLALVLRLARLTYQSLRNDEHFSVYTSSFETLREVIVEGGILDKHPPGYAVFLHYWMLLVGDREFAVRLPSVLAGVLGVWAIYRLGATIGSERLGLVAAGLASVTWMPIAFSQDARSYSLLMLFSTLLVLRVVRHLQSAPESETRWAARLLTLLIATFTAYLHYFGLLMVALVGLVALVPAVRKRLPWADWCTIFFGSAVLYLPWLSAVVTHATNRSSWMKIPSNEVITHVLEQLSSGIWVLAVALFATAVVMHVVQVRKERDREPSNMAPGKVLDSTWVLLLVAWIILPLVSAVVVSYVIIPVISTRNLIIVQPAVCLLLAAAIVKVDGRAFKGRPVVALTVAAALLGHLLFVRHYYHVKTKRDYRAVARYLETEAKKGESDPFIVTESNWNNWFDYYFIPRKGHPGMFDSQNDRLRVSATTPTLKAEMAKQEPDSMWVVINPTRKMSRLPKAYPGYKRVSTRKFCGLHVQHWEKTASRVEPTEPAPEQDGDVTTLPAEAEGVL